MFTSRPLRTTAALAALVLSLAACGASQEESPTESSDTGGVEATEPAQEAPAESADEDTAEGEDSAADEGEDAEDSATETDDAADEDTEDEDDGAAAEPEAGTLTIALDGEETDFTPEIVRCNGEPGTIRNVIITMEDDELPLVKVTPGEFAMVKLDNRGEPEKSSSTTDITAEDGEVSFEGATIGDATVDGTVTCLQGNQG